MSLLDKLLGLAFAQSPARDANEAIARVREQVASELGDASSYEVALHGREEGHLLQVVAPRLALLLRSKRFRVASCAPVFLSIFHGDQLYFVAAPVFFEALREDAGYPVELFAELARGWEETGRWALAALPPAGTVA